MTHPFDAAIALQAQNTGTFTGQPSPAYANLVGPFGGVTAATLLNAVLQDPRRQGEPIALTVNFAAPLNKADFVIHADAVRTNRSTQHWMVQMHQGDEVVATASAVLAQRRQTWGASDTQPPPGLPPAKAMALAATTGLPDWVQRYDMRFAQGGMPDSFDGVEQADAQTLMWLRDEPPRRLDFLALAAMCDSFFPRIFLRRRAFVPIGTVSMSTYFHADGQALAQQGSDHVQARARGVHYRNGYFDQSAEIWSASGQPLASTHQIVYYRE